MRFILDYKTNSEITKEKESEKRLKIRENRQKKTIEVKIQGQKQD